MYPLESAQTPLEPQDFGTDDYSKYFKEHMSLVTAHDNLMSQVSGVDIEYRWTEITQDYDAMVQSFLEVKKKTVLSELDEKLLNSLRQKKDSDLLQLEQELKVSLRSAEEYKAKSNSIL